MIGLLRRHRTGIALSALLTAGMALTACGGGGSSFSGGTSGSGGSSSSGGAGIAIKSAEFPWSAAKLTNVILAEVASSEAAELAELRRAYQAKVQGWLATT